MSHIKRLLVLLMVFMTLCAISVCAFAEGYAASVTAGGSTQSYDTLQAAIDAAEAAGSGATLTVLQDNTAITTPLVIEGGKYNAASQLTHSSWTFTVNNAGQEAPAGVSAVAESEKGKNDGKLQGVDSTMEYRKEGQTTYSPITGTQVTDLAPGKYYVRYQGKLNYDPSADAEVTVAEGAEPDTEPTTKPTAKPDHNVPDTGDDANPILWIILAVLSLLGALAAIIFLKPKKGGKYIRR